MSKNTNLHRARESKNDEFYTQLSDIEKELNHYRKHFKGASVLCNCDDPFESNFFKYFALNFKFLGLKKLVATCYDGSQVAYTESRDLFNFEDEAPKSRAYKIEITEDNIPETDGWDLNNVKELTKKYATLLNGDGDFRSEECIELLKGADIVVTNPPFSLFREYVAQLVEYEKKFLVIGSMNAITYKEIFPLIKDNKLWLGINPVKEFVSPKGEIKKFGNILWYTNLDLKKRHESLILYREYKGHESDYPKYDNYDAINVDKVQDIPCDYEGVMGVPITFLDKFNPEQFEIISFRKGEDGQDLAFTREREREFNRTFESLSDNDSRDDKKCRRQNQWQAYLCTHHDTKEEPIDFFFPNKWQMSGKGRTLVNGTLTYARIFIKRVA